jgi:hypothetical protein
MYLNYYFILKKNAKKTVTFLFKYILIVYHYRSFRDVVEKRNLKRKLTEREKKLC